jgi:hypothetical protein
VALLYEHIYGHQDDAIPFENLSLMEQLNVVADCLSAPFTGDTAGQSPLRTYIWTPR